MEGQPAIYARISATAEPKTLSEKIVEQYYSKYPGKTYNGLELTDLSNDNSPLNQRWLREANSYVDELSAYSGIAPENIFVGKPSQYNNPLNPDRGLGITLNQGSTVEFGVPEFYVKDGLAQIKNGTIYKIYDGEVTVVADILKDGTIRYR